MLFYEFLNRLWYLILFPLVDPPRWLEEDEDKDERPPPPASPIV